MNDITNHIKKATDSLRLSETERRDMSHVVREYMAHKPLPAGRHGLTHGAYSSISLRWFAFSWIHRPLAAALALVFIFGGGVSFAAEGALPGDALYAVKTKVNESVKVALATDTEARANVQMELAERRIEEAATLASENRLDAETQTALAAAFETHASNATREVATIDEDDSSAAAEITSRFETRLAAHEEVLALVSADVNATNTLATAIRGAGLAVADIRARAEERMSVSAPAAMSLAMETAPASATMKAAAPSAPETPSTQMDVADDSAAKYDPRAAERMRNSAEAQLKVAQKKLKSSKASTEVKAQAEAELVLADDHLEEGRVFLKDKASAQAYHAFQQSLVISEKLNVMLKSETSLKKAGARTPDSRASARAKAQEARDEARDDAEEARTEAKIQATATPIQIEVEADAGTSVVHEVVPVIPPPFKIFHFEDEEDEDSDSLINIEL